MTNLAALTPERVLRRLECRVLRRLDGRLQGDYRTVFRGTGVDVADLREYQFGDDLRHIDWNVTARTDVAHVREYLEDREVTAWLLLDRSASMDFGPVQRHKHVVLVEIAATVAQLLSRSGNRVGVGVPEDWRERFIAAYDTEVQGWINAVAAGAGATGPSSWDGYAAQVVCDAGVEALHSGGRVAIELIEKPDLYA